MNNPSETKTDRYEVDAQIYLKRISLEDAAQVLELVEANRTDFSKWLPKLSSVHTLKEMKDFISEKLELIEEKYSEYLLIFYKNELVGAVATNLIRPVDHSTSINYWLTAEAQGKGIMTRALKWFLTHLYTNYQLNRIALQLVVGNAKSKSVAERLGFTYEGIIRHKRFIGGNYRDVISYSMLKSEWL